MMLKLVAFVELGVNEYAVPTVAIVAGVPLIVGIGGFTVIVNAGSDAEPVTLVAVITILLNVPRVVGVPVTAPVELLKLSPGGSVPA